MSQPCPSSADLLLLPPLPSCSKVEAFIRNDGVSRVQAKQDFFGSEDLELFNKTAERKLQPGVASIQGDAAEASVQEMIYFPF